jgi:hypothetical protein
MVVFMVGVNHFDPLGRVDLLERLHALASRHSNPPAFVAVEYDQRHFRSIAGQRDSFRSLIETECDGLRDGKLDAFANSLVYEGDSHHEVFPDVPVLWPDQGRKLSESDLEGYAKQRLNVYLGHSGGDLRGAVEKVSRSIRAMAGTEIDRERSKMFATRIRDRVREVNGSWAIVITGEAHASNSVRGSMRQLLEAAGVNCVSG